VVTRGYKKDEKDGVVCPYGLTTDRGILFE